jgi:hypothetical protein
MCGSDCRVAGVGSVAGLTPSAAVRSEADRVAEDCNTGTSGCGKGAVGSFRPADSSLWEGGGTIVTAGALSRGRDSEAP